MANISVGVNDNVVIAQVFKNEKGTIITKVRKGEDVDPLAALNSSGSTSFTKPERDIMLYPPSVNTFDGAPDTYENVLKKIAEVKDPLDHILRQYTTDKNIKWDIFAGTGITGENITEKLTSQSVVDKIYSNIGDQFIKMMEPFTGDNGKKMRLLLIRQSKAKHFPTFRRRFLESYPFIEPMEVPASKLKFSKFEIDNGLNDGTPAGGGERVPEQEANQVNELFTAN